MKKNNFLLLDRDFTNLLRISMLSRKLSIYGKNIKLNQNDLDNIFCIINGYIKLIERVGNYEKK